MTAALILAGPTQDPVRTLIEKRYADLNRAMVAMDAHRLAEWMNRNAAKGFFYRAGDGSILTADQTLTLMKQEFKSTKAVKRSDYKMTNFSVHPDHASCSVTSHQVVILSGGRRVTIDSTSVDSWVAKNGAWKIASIVTTAETQK